MRKHRIPKANKLYTSTEGALLRSTAGKKEKEFQLQLFDVMNRQQRRLLARLRKRGIE